MTWETATRVISVLALGFSVWSWGYTCGWREERRRWKSAAEREDHWLNRDGTDYIVMERGVFWADYHNPLVRARREKMP